MTIQIMQKSELEALSTPQLTDLWNEIADETGKIQKIKKFANKTAAVNRVVEAMKLLNGSGTTSDESEQINSAATDGGEKEEKAQEETGTAQSDPPQEAATKRERQACIVNDTGYKNIKAAWLGVFGEPGARYVTIDGKQVRMSMSNWKAALSEAEGGSAAFTTADGVLCTWRLIPYADLKAFQAEQEKRQTSYTEAEQAAQAAQAAQEEEAEDTNIWRMFHTEADEPAKPRQNVLGEEDARDNLLEATQAATVALKMATAALANLVSSINLHEGTGAKLSNDDRKEFHFHF